MFFHRFSIFSSIRYLFGDGNSIKYPSYLFFFFFFFPFLSPSTTYPWIDRMLVFLGVTIFWCTKVAIYVCAIIRIQSMDIGGWSLDRGFWLAIGLHSCLATWRDTRAWCNLVERSLILDPRDSTHQRKWAVGILPEKVFVELLTFEICKLLIGTIV